METPVLKSRKVNYTKGVMDILLNEVKKKETYFISYLTKTTTNQIKNKEWEIKACMVSDVEPVSVTRTASQVRGK